MPKIPDFKPCIALLIACAFVLAPMAQAQHVDMQLNTDCSLEHVGAKNPQEEDSGHDFGDHAHCCAICHFSTLRRDSDLAEMIRLAAEIRAVTIQQDYTSRPANGIFHPPRA